MLTLLIMVGRGFEGPPSRALWRTLISTTPREESFSAFRVFLEVPGPIPTNGWKHFQHFADSEFANTTPHRYQCGASTNTRGNTPSITAPSPHHEAPDPPPLEEPPPQLESLELLE